MKKRDPHLPVKRLSITRRMLEEVHGLRHEVFELDMKVDGSGVNSIRSRLNSLDKLIALLADDMQRLSNRLTLLEHKGDS